jgi:hypothetical protein
LIGIFQIIHKFFKNQSADSAPHADRLEAAFYEFTDAQSDPAQVIEAFSFVAEQFLADSLQKWALMESASVAADERLVTLTSVDGDWFLEEMLSLVANCSKLAELTRRAFTKYDRADEALLTSLNLVENLPLVFASLKDLLLGFECQLIATTLQRCVCEPEEVAHLLTALESVGANQAEECPQKLREVAERYNQLLASEDSLMLVQVDKLFARVDLQFERLLRAVRVVDVGPSLVS